MLIIFFVIRGIVHKGFVMQAKQSIPHTIVTFYCDCVKMCENIATDFGGKRIPLHHDNAQSHTPFFTGDFLTKNNVTPSLTDPIFLCFPD
jgi:hypothetical protein